MKCKRCGFDVEVNQEFISTDVLVGEWKGSVFCVLSSKDASYELNAEYLMCTNGHVVHEEYQLEW